MGDRVRIANASGYWGDDPEALARQVRSGTVDYDTERIRGHFADRCGGPVERYELPGLRALNFVLRHALGGGGTVSLRADHHGKSLAQGLLTLALDVPEAVLAATPPDGKG